MNPKQWMQRRLNLGLVLLCWLLVTAGLALNRGIDLLWGMAALLAGALGAGLLLPWLQLRGITLRRLLPAEASVGEALILEYEIEVRGRLPRYGLELLDRLGATAEPVPAAYFHHLAGKRRLRFAWTPQVRGMHDFSGVVIESRFPLGLFSSRRHFALEAQRVVVYPAAVPLRALPVEHGAEPQNRMVLSRRRGGHDEFFGLRPYRHGDTLRSVHWRASARRGELLSIEYEQQQDRCLWIVLDLCAARHVGAGALSSAEMMFKLAHSLVLKARQEGVPAGLLYHDAENLQRVEPALDQVSYLGLREHLALLPLSDLPTPESWLGSESERLPRGGSWLLFNLGGTYARSPLAALCRRRGAQPLLLEFDRDSFHRSMISSGVPPLRHRHDGAPVWILAAGSDLGALLS